jgi:hypothetical protein
MPAPELPPRYACCHRPSTMHASNKRQRIPRNNCKKQTRCVTGTTHTISPECDAYSGPCAPRSTVHPITLPTCTQQQRCDRAAACTQHLRPAMQCSLPLHALIPPTTPLPLCENPTLTHAQKRKKKRECLRLFNACLAHAHDCKPCACTHTCHAPRQTVQLARQCMTCAVCSTHHRRPARGHAHAVECVHCCCHSQLCIALLLPSANLCIAAAARSHTLAPQQQTPRGLRHA